MVQHLDGQQRLRVHRPVKQTLSEATWKLVCEKKHWRTTLARHNQLLRRAALEQLFGCWKSGSNVCADEFSRLGKTQDLAIATALWQFRKLGLAVTTSLGNLLDAKNRAKGHLSKWPWKATMAVEHTHGRGKPFGHENEA